MLSRTPTKDEEIAHYRAFVNDLPPVSYLRSILIDSVPEIEKMIRDDHDWLYSFSQLAHAKTDLETERKALAEENAKLRDETRTLERQHQRIAGSIAEM